MKSDSDAAPPADSNVVKTDEAPGKRLPPAAVRALAEAEARRAAANAVADHPHPKEFQGPTGPEPTRYGDWEKNGIASDF